MFLFYGTYLFRGKPTPIIHAIQKSAVCGRHRFSPAKHKEAYNVFALTLKDNPTWNAYLRDKGVGDAPVEFLVCVEKTFRAVARKDSFAFGNKALATRGDWFNADILWRKREV